MVTNEPADPISLFLDALAEGGRIGSACRASGLSYSKVLRRRKSDPEFARQVDEAKEAFADSVFASVKRRGLGWREPVVFKGEVVEGAYRERYDPKMLELLAKATCPAFRDKVQVDVDHRHVGVLVVEEVAADAEDWVRRFEIPQDQRQLSSPNGERKLSKS